MDNIQSNTKRGPIVGLCNVDLTGKEGYLVKIVNSSGTPKFDLPAAATDAAMYVVLEGAAAGENGTFQPLESGQQVRIVSNSTTIVPGDKIIGYASGQEGKATEYASSAAFIVAIAEEVGDTAGQYLLCRAVLSYIA